MFGVFLIVDLLAWNAVLFNSLYKPNALFWDISKQCRSRNAVSDQGLHCLLIECSIGILNNHEKYHPTSLSHDKVWLGELTVPP